AAPAGPADGSAQDAGDWLVLGDSDPGVPSVLIGDPPATGPAATQAGGSLAPRGGINPAHAGAITPLRLPPPAGLAGSSGALLSGAAPTTTGTTGAAAASGHAPSAAHLATAATTVQAGSGGAAATGAAAIPGPAP